MDGARQVRSMAHVNQKRSDCVNEIRKTQSKPFATRHGMDTAWALHGHGMGSAWARHGHGMGTAWARHGHGMGIAWARYGHGMGTAWARHGHGIGTGKARHAMCESAFIRPSVTIYSIQFIVTLSLIRRAACAHAQFNGCN